VWFLGVRLTEWLDNVIVRHLVQALHVAGIDAFGDFLLGILALWWHHCPIWFGYLFWLSSRVTVIGAASGMDFTSTASISRSPTIPVWSIFSFWFLVPGSCPSSDTTLLQTALSYCLAFLLADGEWSV
jgi:hypothetical protein